MEPIKKIEIQNIISLFFIFFVHFPSFSYSFIAPHQWPMWMLYSNEGSESHEVAVNFIVHQESDTLIAITDSESEIVCIFIVAYLYG